MEDTVGRYIELKNRIKEDTDTVKALRTVILKKNRDDDRISITLGKETLSINADAYENLEAVGVNTTITNTVTTTRTKRLEELDVDIQQELLKTPTNFTKTVGAERINIKKPKKGE